MKRISIPAKDFGYFRLLLDLALLNFSSIQPEQESAEESEADGESDDSYENQLPVRKPKR